MAKYSKDSFFTISQGFSPVDEPVKRLRWWMSCELAVRD